MNVVNLLRGGVIVLTLGIAGCAITPDMVRRRPARDIQSIPTSQQLVADCISKQLRATVPSYYDVIEVVNSVQLKHGSMTLRLYDLEKAVGGTMVTIYVGSPFHVTEGLMVVDYCRKLLVPINQLSESSTNQGVIK